MFTGLVETIGTVLDYTHHDDSATGGNGVSITIGNCSEILTDAKLGDSISTNGVCLTVTEFNLGRTLFKVGVAPETLRITNLGTLKHGAPVNLERAVTSEVRLGGHIVQGHVDTIATIVSKVPDGNAITYTFELRDKEFINYIVHKGFIAIDGTSLTVTNVEPTKGQFSIMLISYSQEKVILSKKEVGDTVNIEVDLTGKLIEKQIEVNLTSQIENDDSPLNKLITSLVEKKVKEFLK
ncbi:RIB5 Riboflavin synthase [Candida maltosa Xu316]|uniref:Riboflavin synthase n=1 Tax=Candida maltosa (strain Xu316) TaxID=1245528 RepID=M3JY72_CANMX|nr:Riboflavin synthase alpha chain [Candida maltosa Xu316]